MALRRSQVRTLSGPPFSRSPPEKSGGDFFAVQDGAPRQDVKFAVAPLAKLSTDERAPVNFDRTVVDGGAVGRESNPAATILRAAMIRATAPGSPAVDGPTCA